MSRKQYFRKQKLVGLSMVGCGMVMALVSYMISWGSLAALAGIVAAAGIGVCRTRQMLLCV